MFLCKKIGPARLLFPYSNPDKPLSSKLSGDGDDDGVRRGNHKWFRTNIPRNNMAVVADRRGRSG